MSRGSLGLGGTKQKRGAVQERALALETQVNNEMEEGGMNAPRGGVGGKGKQMYRKVIGGESERPGLLEESS